MLIANTTRSAHLEHLSKRRTLQYISGRLFERNREQWGNIGIRSIDAKITQTTNLIVDICMTKAIGYYG